MSVLISLLISLPLVAAAVFGVGSLYGNMEAALFGSTALSASPDLTAGVPNDPDGSNDPDKAVIFEGARVDFTGGSIRNVGDAPTMSSSGFFINEYQVALGGDENNLEFVEVRIPFQLDVNTSVVVEGKWSAKAGEHKVRLVADTDKNRVKESDELNNASPWVHFEVKPQPLPNPDNDDDRPTLNLSAIEPQAGPVNVTEGDLVYFTSGRAENTGTLNTARTFQNRYELAPHRDRNNTEKYETGLISLDAGEHAYVNSQSAWEAVAGRHEFRFVVDSDQDISESDETDNKSRWRNIVVAAKPIAECADGVDNDDPEDTDADDEDSGCWSDPDDEDTYDPDDDDETNPEQAGVNLTVTRPSVLGTYTAGRVVTFADGSVENEGPEDVGTAFDNWYELDLYSNSAPSEYIKLRTGSVSVLLADASAYPGEEGWTAIEGTHRVRFVADVHNSVGETDESDNTSPWVTFAVTEAREDDDDGDGAPPRVDLKVNNEDGPLTISSGQDVTLSWTVTGGGADSCDSDFLPFPPGPSPSGGSHPETGPTLGDRWYTISCENKSNTDGDSVQVIVAGSGLNIDATPTRVRRGSESELMWDVDGHSSCVIAGSNGHRFIVTSSGRGDTLPLFGETLYTINCGSGNTDSVTIRILPAFEEI